MNEEDVRMAMKLPWVATASDGSAKTPSASMPHPRSFGTYPRKIGYYAHDEKVLAMEAAVRSASALPAEIIGLSDRGRIQEEMKADIVVFDPDHFRDQATYDQPYLPPTGLTHVLVNGRTRYMPAILPEFSPVKLFESQLPSSVLKKVSGTLQR